MTPESSQAMQHCTVIVNDSETKLSKEQEVNDNSCPRPFLFKLNTELYSGVFIAHLNTDAVLLRKTPVKSQTALIISARKQKEGGGNTSHIPAALLKAVLTSVSMHGTTRKALAGLMLPLVIVLLWGLAARVTNHHPTQVPTCTSLQVKGLCTNLIQTSAFLIRYAETR